MGTCVVRAGVGADPDCTRLYDHGGLGHALCASRDCDSGLRLAPSVWLSLAFAGPGEHAVAMRARVGAGRRQAC